MKHVVVSKKGNTYFVIMAKDDDDHESFREAREFFSLEEITAAMAEFFVEIKGPH